MRRALPSILKPRHFENSLLSLTGRGLRFDERVELSDIESEVGPEIVGPIAETYSPLRCVINPYAPSKGNLYKSLRRAQTDAKTESFNIGYGDRGDASYDANWSVTRAEGFIIEGQTIHVVGMDGGRAVGYASVNTSVYWDEERSACSLVMSPNLVYVRPKQRGKGCGIALSVVVGWVGQSLVRALYGAVPTGASLDATVIADYDSKGGGRFVEHMTGSLEVTLDCLREQCRRPSVKLGNVDLDAGW